MAVAAVGHLMTNPVHILTINGGSSSIKFALYQIGEPLVVNAQGKMVARSTFG